jgi:DNA-binding protein HU-beta
MTKKELISLLHDGVNNSARIGDGHRVSKTAVAELLDVLSTEAAMGLAEEGEFLLPGIGKLVVVNKEARMGRNPKTGEALEIPAKRAVKLKVAGVIEEYLNHAEGIIGEQLTAKRPALS